MPYAVCMPCLAGRHGAAPTPGAALKKQRAALWRPPLMPSQAVAFTAGSRSDAEGSMPRHRSRHWRPRRPLKRPSALPLPRSSRLWKSYGSPLNEYKNQTMCTCVDGGGRQMSALGSVGISGTTETGKLPEPKGKTTRGMAGATACAAQPWHACMRQTASWPQGSWQQSRTGCAIAITDCRVMTRHTAMASRRRMWATIACADQPRHHPSNELPCLLKVVHG